MNLRDMTSNLQGRRLFLVACMVLFLLTLVGRAVSLQVVDKEFLQGQGQARHMRVV